MKLLIQLRADARAAKETDGLHDRRLDSRGAKGVAFPSTDPYLSML